MLTTKEVIAKYGKPDADGSDYLVKLDLPYPMRLSWDKKTTVSRIFCHRLVHDKLKAIFEEIIAHYGMKEIQRLGIDLFGGCFAFRKMRGGSDYSKHCWGIAIDLDPVRNGLKTTWAKAQFSKPEYAPMIEIFYKHGYVNLGKEKNYDAMHFEPKD